MFKNKFPFLIGKFIKKCSLEINQEISCMLEITVYKSNRLKNGGIYVQYIIN